MIFSESFLNKICAQLISEDLESAILSKFKNLIKAPINFLKYKLYFELNNNQNITNSEASIVIHMKPTVNDPIGLYEIVGPISAIINVRTESFGILSHVMTEHYAGDEKLIGGEGFNQKPKLIRSSFEETAKVVNDRFKEWAKDVANLENDYELKNILIKQFNLESETKNFLFDGLEPDDPADNWKK